MFWLLASGCGETVPVVLELDASMDAEPTRPRERCNGRDDDADGKLDEGCPMRLTRTDGIDYQPQLRDGVLHWIAESGPTGAEPGGVYAYDLVAGTWMPRPGIRGGYLWFDDEGHVASADFTGCYVLDLATGISTDAILVASGDVFQQRCAVDGDYMATTAEIGVWGYYDVYYYRLSTGASVSIPLSGDQMYAAIDDELIAWVDRRDNAIWAYRIGGNRGPYRVTEPPEGPAYDIHHRPVLRDGLVLNAHDCKVELYDAETAELVFFAMRESLCYATSFAFSERFIAIGVDEKIRLLDRATGADYAVTTYDRAATDAVLDERFLVYIDERTDHFDLYALDLSDFDEGDFFPEGLPP